MFPRSATSGYVGPALRHRAEVEVKGLLLVLRGIHDDVLLALLTGGRKRLVSRYRALFPGSASSRSDDLVLSRPGSSGSRG